MGDGRGRLSGRMRLPSPTSIRASSTRERGLPGALRAEGYGRGNPRPEPPVGGWVGRFQQVLGGGEPARETGSHCNTPFECAYKAYCGGEPPEYPVEILPRGGKLVAALREEGYRDLTEVPEARLTSEQHLRVWRASRSGQAEHDEARGGYHAPSLIRGTTWTSRPRSSPSRPGRARVPTSSCPSSGPTMWRRPTAASQHREFLDVSGAPPMRAFAESLIRALRRTRPGRGLQRVRVARAGRARGAVFRTCAASSSGSGGASWISCRSSSSTITTPP